MSWRDDHQYAADDQEGPEDNWGNHRDYQPRDERGRGARPVPGRDGRGSGPRDFQRRDPRLSLIHI